MSSMMMWVLLRAAGIGAYLMLFLSVAWGLVSTTSLVTKRVSKSSSTLFHQFCATVGVALIFVHVIALLLDSYMPFRWLDILIPMHSSFRPGAIAVGVVAMYGAVIVLVSSWLRKPLGTKIWRAIHLLSVPAFTLALAHGVFAGTDTGRSWMWATYAATGILVFFLVAVRGLTHGYRPPRQAPPPRAGTSSRDSESTSVSAGGSSTQRKPDETASTSSSAGSHRP